MVLNRQLIKILEDLGVNGSALENLQRLAVEDLKSRTLSISNAVAFLEEHNVGQATHTTWLIRKVESLGVSLNNERFFWDMLYALTLLQLQEMKNRTRIPIAKGRV